MINKLYNFADTLKDKDGILANLFKFLYGIFSNASIQTVTNTFLGVLIPCIVVKNNKLLWQNCLLTMGSLALINATFQICNNYKNRNFNDRKFASLIVDRCSWIINSISIDIYKRSNYKNNILKVVGDMVCSEISSICKSIYGIETRVSIEYIFERNTNGKSESFTKMISRYSPKRQGVRNKAYKINNRERKSYFSNQVFRNNKTGIYFLLRSDIRNPEKWFINPNHENKTVQYLAIAQTVDGQNVSFIFQIDSLSRELFGNNKEEAEEFANKHLIIFVNLLCLAYTLNMDKNKKVGEING